ncbi:hypothetical protein Bbelb_301420 [Branchiostoma belcheri]|nr:hypothetical protein Bbelb_301420 [Branchiostoma belcheri]
MGIRIQKLKPKLRRPPPLQLAIDQCPCPVICQETSQRTTDPERAQKIVSTPKIILTYQHTNQIHQHVRGHRGAPYGSATWRNYEERQAKQQNKNFKQMLGTTCVEQCSSVVCRNYEHSADR